MTPASGRVWRRAQRRAWRGQPGGRRGTHQVYITYGQRMRAQDWTAHWTRGDEAALLRYTTLAPGSRLRQP